jgi:hypothetical protein
MAMGWTARVLFPAWKTNFLSSPQYPALLSCPPSLLPNRLWFPPILPSIEYWGYFPGTERLGHNADHLTPSSAKVKKSGAILSTPHLHGILCNELCTEISNFFNKIQT